MDRIRVGLKGFGEIPRHIFRLCLDDPRIEVVTISDLGQPEILAYLIAAETKGKAKTKLEGNYLVSDNGKARFIAGGEPGKIPWDMFDVDVVVEGTWSFRSRADLQKHIDSGAPRVILTSLPADNVDRVVIHGINENTIQHADQIVSAGSATTYAAALLLNALDKHYGVDYAMLTSVHSYTSDQPLRDRVGSDYRKSRSAAENIIPLETPVPMWIEHIMPNLKGKVAGTLLNVPVPNGSMLDMTTVFKKSGITKDDVNAAISKEAELLPHLIQLVDDPIVSSDVIDNKHSVVFDKIATMTSPGRMVKTLSWYHSAYAMANRIKELILSYHEVDKKGGKQ